MSAETTGRVAAPPTLDTEIVILGSGIAGIGLGIKLKENGFDDFIIVEKADDIGGTWRDNTYPGLTVDIPALTFSFSFEPKPDWSSLWAPQPEVLEYLRHCVERYGLRSHIRFRQEVLETEFDPDRNVWVTRMRDERTYTSRYFVNGSGYLSVPKMPDIDGIEDFAGRVIHSAAWDHGADLTGKRIAFIGTGATGIQLAPKLAPTASRLHIFQRTPVWLLPKPRFVLPRALQVVFKHVPGVQRIARLAIFALMDVGFYRIYTNYPQAKIITKIAQQACADHIRRQVHDAEIARKLTPDYTWGCKRPSFSQEFYPMFNRSNVELVTDPIARVERDAVVTSDGERREVDVIVCATGYQPFEKTALPPYPVYGKDGTDLRDYWDKNRYQAYQGFAVAGYPNFFLIFGPYAVAGTSYFALVETAVRNIITCLKAARSQQSDYVEVSADAQQAEFAKIQDRKPRSLLAAANCAGSNTFYIDRFGDFPGFRPYHHPQTWWESRRFALQNFVFRRPPKGAPMPAVRLQSP